MVFQTSVSIFLQLLFPLNVKNAQIVREELRMVKKVNVKKHLLGAIKK
jgi:hypothetical protein